MILLCCNISAATGRGGAASRLFVALGWTAFAGRVRPPGLVEKVFEHGLLSVRNLSSGRSGGRFSPGSIHCRRLSVAGPNSGAVERDEGPGVGSAVRIFSSRRRPNKQAARLRLGTPLRANGCVFEFGPRRGFRAKSRSTRQSTSCTWRKCLKSLGIKWRDVSPFKRLFLTLDALRYTSRA
jgi:hypothetical protein